MVRTIKTNDGKSMPAIGWGNGSQGLQNSGKLAIGLGTDALKAGVLHIDTAQAYGTEKETGEAIKAAGLKPEDVWVTTKSMSPEYRTCIGADRSQFLEVSLPCLHSKPLFLSY